MSVKVQLKLVQQLHYYKNIHMYEFHDDAGHHHGSQYKQITAYKRQAPSLAWALPLLLPPFSLHEHCLGILALTLGNFTLLDLGLNLLKTLNNLLDKCLI